jgi:hypothetical protein
VPVQAGPAEQAELDEIDIRQENMNLQKDWAQYRYDQAQHECYSKFFTTNCLDQARLVHRKEMREIRAQEVLMHDRQRALKAILKDEQDAQRDAEHKDPSKAAQRTENVKAYEQKQIDKKNREIELEKKHSDTKNRAEENKKASPF